MIFKDGIRPEWEVDWVDASFGCLLVLSGFPVVLSPISSSETVSSCLHANILLLPCSPIDSGFSPVSRINTIGIVTSASSLHRNHHRHKHHDDDVMMTTAIILVSSLLLIRITRSIRLVPLPDVCCRYSELLVFSCSAHRIGLGLPAQSQSFIGFAGFTTVNATTA